MLKHCAADDGDNVNIYGKLLIDQTHRGYQAALKRCDSPRNYYHGSHDHKWTYNTVRGEGDEWWKTQVTTLQTQKITTLRGTQTQKQTNTPTKMIMLILFWQRVRAINLSDTHKMHLLA